MTSRQKILVVAVVFGIGAFVSVRVWKAIEAGSETAPPVGGPAEPKANFLPEAKVSSPPAVGSAAGAVLSTEKAARIEKIRRDYEEIRAKMSADYTAAGANFPGGLNAFLRQLALLEREMHGDFAAALTPRELEDYEMHESTTGQSLQRRLAGVAVTEEQRREVFRLQREFDDRFALVFDVTPPALLERWKVQVELREKIRARLGDEAYAAWLKPEDGTYAAMRSLARQQGLPETSLTELWRIKNDWTQRKLEIAAQAGLAAEQRTAMHAALAEQTRSRVAALVGTDAMAPGSEALAWLPPGP